MNHKLKTFIQDQILMNRLGKYIAELEQVLNSLPADMVYYINYGLNKINLDDVNLGIRLNPKHFPSHTTPEVLKEFERTLELSLIDFIREGLVNKMKTEFSRFYVPTDGGTFIDIYAPIEKAFQRTPTNKKIELLDAKIEFGAEVSENFDLKTYFGSALHEFCVQKLLPDVNAISNPRLGYDEHISYEKEFESTFDNNLKNSLIPSLLAKIDLDSYVRYKTEEEIENLVNSINALKEEKTQIYSNPSKISEAYGESSAQLDKFKLSTDKEIGNLKNSLKRANYSADRLESRIQSKNSMLALLGLLITVLTCGFGYFIYEQMNAKRQIKTELEQLRNEKIESDKLSQSKIESLESLVEGQTTPLLIDSTTTQAKDSTGAVYQDSIDDIKVLKKGE